MARERALQLLQRTANDGQGGHEEGAAMVDPGYLKLSEIGGGGQVRKEGSSGDEDGQNIRPT